MVLKTSNLTTSKPYFYFSATLLPSLFNTWTSLERSNTAFSKLWSNSIASWGQARVQSIQNIQKNKQIKQKNTNKSKTKISNKNEDDLLKFDIDDVNRGMKMMDLSDEDLERGMEIIKHMNTLEDTITEVTLRKCIWLCNQLLQIILIL